MGVIECKNVTKVYRVPEKPKPGAWNKIRSLFYRKWLKKIIKNVSFTLKEGEFVGYVGPNGAGKSTTIKLLTGVLTPTSGSIRVLGFDPGKERYEYTYNIGVVFGHRSLLEFDIPVVESFKLFKAIYELDEETFRERLEYFADMLNIKDLLHIPVRKLSLGQRMRCELAASLLHKPKVIFLDEPTIGLDAVSKEEIRNFLTKVNREEKVTIILTTHDMDDIEALCNRIILIDEGKIVYDGDLGKFTQGYVKHKTVEFQTGRVKKKAKYEAALKLADSVEEAGRLVRLRVDIKKHKIAAVLDKILASAEVDDLTVHSPRLEHVIKEAYKKESKKKKG